MTSLQINSSNPEQLPSTPILKGDELYSGALALAVAAGAIKQGDEPTSVTYAHSTRSWQIGW